MIDKLRLRAYNVLFGDALLLSVPDRDETGTTTLRHILIDVGNAYQDKHGGAKDYVFAPVVEDICQELQGRPLDLYILTHEHMDHVQGLRHAAMKVHPGIEFPIAQAWLTASAAPDYHTRFPDTTELRKAAMAGVRRAAAALRASGDDLPLHAPLLLDINDPGLTDECVLYILGRAAQKEFVFRDDALDGKHPFHEVKFDIWAPEQDASVYYRGVRQVALAVDGAPDPADPKKPPALKRLPPPMGVDASAFNNLLKMRRGSLMDTLLCIDKAANNTSVVFTLEWRGWKLLFAGDAEQKSWEMMESQGKLGPVDFIKVSHHGSQTGTPPAEVLKKLFPPGAAKQRMGLVSTYRDTYNDVPDTDALGEYEAAGVELVRVGDAEYPGNCAPGKYIDIFFPENGDAPELGSD